MHNLAELSVQVSRTASPAVKQRGVRVGNLGHGFGW